MCGIEHLLCGIPRPGAVDNFLMFSAGAVWVYFLAVIGQYLLRIIATDIAYEFIVDALGGLAAAIIFSYFLQLTRTIYSLNARLVELETAKMDIHTAI
jgi:hypothetical protein